MNWDEFILGLIIVAAALIIVVGGVYTAAGMRTQATCLAKGWPSHKVNVFLVGYCIKRVDQTDVVVPVSELTP